MNAIVDFGLCTLSDEELISLIDKKTDEIFESQTVPVRHIPARPNDDYDLLVGELLVRFGKVKEKAWMYDQLDK